VNDVIVALKNIEFQLCIHSICFCVNYNARRVDFGQIKGNVKHLRGVLDGLSIGCFYKEDASRWVISS